MIIVGQFNCECIRKWDFLRVCVSKDRWKIWENIGTGETSNGIRCVIPRRATMDEVILMPEQEAKAKRIEDIVWAGAAAEIRAVARIFD